MSGSGVGTDPAVLLRKADVVVRESPTGTINGSNTVFGLASAPVAGSEMVFLNGQLLDPGAGDDYTIAGQNITFASAPVVGDRIVAWYLK